MSCCCCWWWRWKDSCLIDVVDDDDDDDRMVVVLLLLMIMVMTAMTRMIKKKKREKDYVCFLHCREGNFEVCLLPVHARKRDGSNYYLPQHVCSFVLRWVRSFNLDSTGDFHLREYCGLGYIPFIKNTNISLLDNNLRKQLFVAFFRSTLPASHVVLVIVAITHWCNTVIITQFYLAFLLETDRGNRATITFKGNRGDRGTLS